MLTKRLEQQPALTKARHLWPGQRTQKAVGDTWSRQPTPIYLTTLDLPALGLVPVRSLHSCLPPIQHRVRARAAHKLVQGQQHGVGTQQELNKGSQEREKGRAVKTVSLDTEPPWKFFSFSWFGSQSASISLLFSETFFTDFCHLHKLSLATDTVLNTDKMKLRRKLCISHRPNSQASCCSLGDTQKHVGKVVTP